MFLQRLKAAIIVGVVLAALLTALGFAIYFARQEEGETPEAIPQASPAASAQLPVAGGQYVAQEGDSCWSIAKSLTGIGSEENVRVFATLNSFAISQEARRWGTSYEECPIVAGQSYKVPAQWVPQAAVAQISQSEQSDDGCLGKIVATVLIVLAVGMVIGAFAPPPLRLFRRKKDLSQLPSDWDPSEQEQQ